MLTSETCATCRNIAYWPSHTGWTQYILVVLNIVPRPYLRITTAPYLSWVWLCCPSLFDLFKGYTHNSLLNLSSFARTPLRDGLSSALLVGTPPYLRSSRRKFQSDQTRQCLRPQSKRHKKTNGTWKCTNVISVRHTVQLSP